MPASIQAIHLRNRRRLLAASSIALPALWLSRQARAAALRPTPSQTEGPYYPVMFPKDSDHNLLKNGELQYPTRNPAWVEGSVRDTQGFAVPGAVVEIWQCDESGHYDHPGDSVRPDPAFQGFGRVVVGLDGKYRFHTIKPVPYAGRTPHIHVKVKLRQRELLTTQIYVADHPGNTRDFLWRALSEEDRAALTVPFTPGPTGLQARFDLVVKLPTAASPA